MLFLTFNVCEVLEYYITIIYLLSLKLFLTLIFFVLVYDLI